MVSFTGTTRAGKRVSELARASRSSAWRWSWAASPPRSILDDADLPQAVKGTVNACFLNSGQTCSAHTRMLVPRARYDEALEAIAAKVVETFTLGDPLVETTRLGPLDFGRAEGARDRLHPARAWRRAPNWWLAAPRPPRASTSGYFVRSRRCSANVDPKATIAQEEIFGPVLTVILL